MKNLTKYDILTFFFAFKIDDPGTVFRIAFGPDIQYLNLFHNILKLILLYLGYINILNILQNLLFIIVNYFNLLQKHYSRYVIICFEYTEILF